MRSPDIKISISLSSAILCIFLLMGISIGIIASANLEEVRGENGGRLPSTRVLRSIHTSTLEYRLAEMYHLLSLEHKEMKDYENRMKMLLKRLKQDQQTYETLIRSQEEGDLYERYILEWQEYLKGSQRAISLSKNNIKEQAAAMLRENTWPFYQKLNTTLNRLLELNKNYANSPSRFWKDLFREFRLAINILFIIGITAFFILVFNLFEKMKKNKKSES